MKIVNVVGARPNFIKIAPLVKEMSNYPEIDKLLLHTGQHYDYKMSQAFFEDLELPKPDVYFGVGGGSHATQTAQIMVKFEDFVLNWKPDIVLIVGDVNSTVACALTAAKLQIPIAHVEAGLRSFDRRMPEEINRVVTDALSEHLFTPSRDANENLQREGVSEEKIFFVGNVMIDTLLTYREWALALDTFSRFGLEKSEYAVLTLHRPSNVDDLQTLSGIVEALTVIQQRHNSFKISASLIWFKPCLA
jgi:UDP-N-acetylglucosamine 2-epimerase (non-hydrolysing)